MIHRNACVNVRSVHLFFCYVYCVWKFVNKTKWTQQTRPENTDELKESLAKCAQNTHKKRGEHTKLITPEKIYLFEKVDTPTL